MMMIDIGLGIVAFVGLIIMAVIMIVVLSLFFEVALILILSMIVAKLAMYKWAIKTIKGKKWKK